MPAVCAIDHGQERREAAGLEAEVRAARAAEEGQVSEEEEDSDIDVDAPAPHPTDEGQKGEKEKVLRKRLVFQLILCPQHYISFLLFMQRSGTEQDPQPSGTGLSKTKGEKSKYPKVCQSVSNASVFQHL